MEKRENNKIKFKRSRIVLTLVYAALSVAAFSLRVLVPPERRYIRQLIVLVGTLFLILTAISFLRLFTYEIRRELYRRVSKALFNAGEKWRAVKAKVRKLLGLPEKSDLAGSDERKIVFDEERRKRKQKPLPKLKYSDLNDNRSRIRFLFARYVIDRASKDDPPIISDTAGDMEKKLPDEKEKAPLVEIYRVARYAPEEVAVSDSDVVVQAAFVGTSGKI